MGVQLARVTAELIRRLRMLEVGKYYSTRQAAKRWKISKESARGFLRYWAKKGIFFSPFRGWWQIGIAGENVLRDVSQWSGEA